MNIAIIGTGYVGLVTGTDLASRGHYVTCVDVNAERIAGLQQGVMPFFEQGLPELVAAGVSAGRLSFTIDAVTAMRNADVVISAVGTPLGADGRADLSAVYNVAGTFGSAIEHRAIFVNKSTVPVGTAAICTALIAEALQARGANHEFAVVSNPEFLSQGTAVRDTAQPTRIVVGTNDAAARGVMRELYASFIAADIPYVEMSCKSAEVAKCAANAFLATKISFMNEIANFCERTGAQVDEVAESMGLDPRIGPAFLRAGLGYGGGCIPKDTAALIASGRDVGYDFRILTAVEEVNALQRGVMYDKLVQLMPERTGRRIAVWGLAFKPGTDDLRSAPSLAVVERLLAEGAEVIAFDPAAGEGAVRQFPGLQLASDPLAAATGADALLICTEWPEFSAFDLGLIVDLMSGAVIIDGRGVFTAQTKPKKLRYAAVGWSDLAD